MLAVEVLVEDSDQSSARAILLTSIVQGKVVTILIDSGSSCSFISDTLAAQLSGAT